MSDYEQGQAVAKAKGVKFGAGARGRRGVLPGIVVHLLMPKGSVGSSAVVTKKDVNLADSVRFNGQDPVSRSGKTTGRGAFEMQSAQASSAAYYFDLAARDYILADGAIELVIEGAPCSAFIEPSQSSELIFYGQSDRLRGKKHAADGGKFRRDLQEQSASRPRF